MARKKHTLGCLFYIALVLLVLVIFFFNRKAVQEAIDKTGFAKLFQKQTEATPEVVVSPPESPSPEQAPTHEQSHGGNEVVVTIRDPTSEQKAPEERSSPEEKPQIRTRQARLFFLTVASDGTIGLKGVIRPVEYTDAPLTATVQALLKGPSTAEVNQGLITMISPQTRLRRVYVKEDTAYLDFNEAFRFNSLGKEGLIAQLQQVVYSATEFSNVKQVQFLIEGSVTEHLGPEGVLIGKPLARESFRN